MTVDNIITVIGLIGIGGVLKAGFDFIISKRKSKEEAKQTFKEIRYKAIILLCYAFVFYDKEKTNLVINRPDINSIDRLKNEIQAEFFNMSLFASDLVLIEIKKFLLQPDVHSLNDLALAMRKDLYGIRTKLKDDHFNVTM